jgi:hypothetical protein
MISFYAVVGVVQRHWCVWLHQQHEFSSAMKDDFSYTLGPANPQGPEMRHRLAKFSLEDTRQGTEVLLLGLE